MIIGLTGRIAAGKGLVAECLMENYGFGYETVSMEVRREVKSRGYNEEEIKRSLLQDIGNEIRQREGSGAWMNRILKRVDLSKNITIDGIRNPGEISVLRMQDNFYLFSVDALKIKRYNRIISRGKQSDPKTWEEFLEMDRRDYREDDPLGQQVGKCMEQADYHLINNSTVEEFNYKIRRLFSNLIDKN